jgi:hypothetical protein
MKILFISPPFVGHALVQHRAAEKLRKDDSKVELIMVYMTWKDYPIPNSLKKSDAHFDQVIELSSPKTLTTTNPMVWCAEQSEDLREILCQNLKKWHPDTVVYDAFTWVYLTQAPEFPQIRFICSLSGFLGSISEEKSTKISDALYEEAPINLVWSQPNIISRELDRSKYFFQGYPVNPEKKIHEEKSRHSQKIVVSLGSVITSSYMWQKNNNASNDISDFVVRIFKAIAQLAQTKACRHVQFLMVTGGIWQLRALCEHISNIECVTWIDQASHLTSTSVLVTHGGNNSIQEALAYRVPMLVIPFFGDQHDTADWVVKNNMGKSIPLIRDDRVSTQGPKTRDISQVGAMIQDLLTWHRGRFAFTSRFTLSPYAIMCNRIPFQPGDVLLGCNQAREKYIRDREGFEYFGFSKTPEDGQAIIWRRHHDYALLLDNYTDVFRDYVSAPISSSLQDRVMTQAIEYLHEQKVTPQSTASVLCCHLLDFILKQGWQLHFLLDNFDIGRNVVTRTELIHLIRHWNHEIGRKVHFYVMQPYLRAVNIYNDHSCLREILNYIIVHNTPDSVDYHITDLILTKHHIYSLDSVKPQFRVKSMISILNNLKRSNEIYEKTDALHDLLGYRYFTIGQLDPNLASKGWRLSEENHVGHYQYDDITELQVWSLVMYAGFALEHDSIYKSIGFISREKIEASHKLRQLQLQLQCEIDKLL